MSNFTTVSKKGAGQVGVRPANRRQFGPLCVFAIPKDWPVNDVASVGVELAIDLSLLMSGLFVARED